MSYRPKEQELEGPIDKITEGIREFDRAVDERIDSREWKEEHIGELAELSIELRKLRMKLAKLKQETW